MGAPTVVQSQQYSDTIALLVQQMESRLMPKVMVDRNWTGKAKYYDQYGSDTMTEIMDRYQSTPMQLPNFARRKVAPRYFVSNTPFDRFDELTILFDPKSASMQSKRMAAQRKADELIIAAATGTAYTGEAGATSQALTLTVAVTDTDGLANYPMTKAKALHAKYHLDVGEVEENDRVMVVTAKQMEDLLLTTEVTSREYNVIAPLVEGTLKTWCGFEWIRTELLSVASSIRTCIAFQKKGIQLAIQKEAESRLTERADLNYAWQVYLRMCMGATRLEEARVVSVACYEA